MNQKFWQDAVAVLWFVWVVYWFANAARVKPTRWREPLWSQSLHYVPLILAAVLLSGGHARAGFLTGHFLPRDLLTGALGTLTVAAGVVFSIWARRCLGANWSGMVTVKQDHALIRSGPYRFVRHPIYSGMLLGIAGTAVVFGQWRDLLAFGLVFAGFVYKAQVEERRMRETFPDYDAYRSQTAALVPFIY
jgi:protein-S-isoprenylcysteine O-methyltransferase Ste14